MPYRQYSSHATTAKGKEPNLDKQTHYSFQIDLPIYVYLNDKFKQIRTVKMFDSTLLHIKYFDIIVRPSTHFHNKMVK